MYVTEKYTNVVDTRNFIYSLVTISKYSNYAED